MKKLFTFLLVLATSIGMTRATQLWPILMDEQTYNTYGKYVVSDFRPNGTDRQFYIWSGTYNGISATGLNFFGNTEGYLAAAVASDWAGAGYCLTDMGTSWSKAKALQDAIVANPDNYFLHVAIKSADNFSHCFYLFDCEATKFVLGSHKVYNGALFSDFKRDGLWHDLYIPMSRFASALAANTACKEGVNIMALLTEGIPGAQLNLDAVYFCDKEMKELLHSNAEPAIPVEVNARVIDFTSSATSIDDWNISEATLNESESDEKKGKFVYDTKGGILSETSMKTELNVAFQYKNGSDKAKAFVVYPGKCYEFGGRNGVLIVKNTHLGDTIILTAAAKGSNEANFADPEGVYPINASALSSDLTLPVKGSDGADAQGFVWNELEYTSLGGDVQIKEFNAGYRIKKIQIKDAYYTLTTSNEDPKEGTTAGDKKALFASELKISATPNYGYHFTQWSDKNKQNPRSVILTQDTAFTAEFAKNTYTITTNSSNAEWGAAKGGKAALYLDEISISAVPNYGYHFTQWKDGDKQNPRKVIVTEDKTYTATFAKNVYNITMNAEHGNISGKSSAEYLDEVTMNVTADYGYHFAQWSDGNKQNPRTFVLTQDTAFTAEFAKNTYTITTNSSNAEWGAAKGGIAALYLDEISISAVPNYGYHFTQWTDGNKQNPRTVQVTEDKTYTATFAKNVYNITMNAEHGNISGKSSAEYLDEVTMNVTADYGYHFAQWSDGKTDNPRTFVLTQDTAFTAEFAKNTYTVKFLDWDGKELKSESVEHGSAATAPNDPTRKGYSFIGWDKKFDNITEDLTLTAQYEEIDYTPQNLKAALVLQEEDVLITLSWDKVQGAASYELRVAVGEKELFSQNTMGINAIASLLSSIVKDYDLPAGTYTINWFVRSTDEEGKAISDWAQGEDFEVTIKDPATGLDRIQDTHVHSTKMLIDGVLYIERNGVLYDANGRIAQ